MNERKKRGEGVELLEKKSFFRRNLALKQRLGWAVWILQINTLTISSGLGMYRPSISKPSSGLVHPWRDDLKPE